MRNLTRKGAVLVASTAVGVLALGGAGGAWAVVAPSGGGSGHGSASGAAGPAAVSGTVTSVAAGSFVLTGSGGSVVTVDTDASTVFAETGAVVPPGGVSSGEQVTVTPVTGTPAGASTVTAARVLVVLTHVQGTVRSVGAGTFTEQIQGGLVVTVVTTPSTGFRMNGTTQTGVAVGQWVTSYGAPDPADPSQLDAEFVVISVPPPAPVPPVPGSPRHHDRWQLLTGSVTSVGAGTFLLTEATGTTVTITTTATTTYAETGSGTVPPGVTVGEQVRVTATGDPAPGATTATAARVVVVLTQVTGSVDHVGAGTFTVQLYGGLDITVATSSSTVFRQSGASVTGVAVGQKVTAFGTGDPMAPAQLDARFVYVDDPAATGTPGRHGDHGGSDGDTDDSGSPAGGGHDPSPTAAGTGRDPSPGATGASAHAFVTGTVQSVTGPDIVVVGHPGPAVTVVVSTTTRYLGRPGADTVAAITAGVTIAAVGTTDGSGNVDAQVVLVGSFPSGGDPAGPTVGAGTTPPGGDGAGGAGTTVEPATSAPSATSTTWAAGSGPQGGQRQTAGWNGSDGRGGAAPTPVPTASSPAHAGQVVAGGQGAVGDQPSGGPTWPGRSGVTGGGGRG